MNSIYSAAFAISDNGNIAGRLSASSFFYSNGSMYDIGTLGGSSSTAQGVNDAGQITGSSYIQSVNYQRAFLYQNGAMKDLGTLGGNESRAFGINRLGQVVGSSLLINGYYHAFLYSDGFIQDIGTLGGGVSIAYAINDLSQVVGSSVFADSPFLRAFLYSNSSMKSIGHLGGNESVAYSINSSEEIVGTSLESGPGTYRAFIYSGGNMRNLNNYLINQSSGWSLRYAYGINDAGQIVGTGINPSNKFHGFLLNPVPIEEVEAILGTQLPKPVFGNYPTKEAGKDSLVLVTHGWQPYPLNPDVSWVDDMSNYISSYVLSSGLTNWQVYGYKWVTNAWKVGSPDALANAKQEGLNLGSAMSVQGWSNVHLIAHSAGAALIQEASEWIKAVSPSTIVQCTFLEPDLGNDKAGIISYGRGADWSDNYFVGDFITGSRTGCCLSNAYNVDVKLLDAVRVTGISKFVSANGETEVICHVSGTSHQWPRYFYTNTIVGNTNLEYKGFGFPLSKEGGNWNYALANYATGNIPAHILGTIDCDVEPPVTPIVWPDQPVNFTQWPTIQSVSGSVQKWAGSVKMYPGSPVWMATLITATNPINSLSFDLVFSGTNNSDSLFSVYWDTNVIGTIDEKYVRPGLQHYSLSFPQAIANSSYVLGFRLDPYTNALLSVTLTNIVIKQIGVSQPFSLSLVTNSVIGLVYELKGESGFNYAIQASSNLVDWVEVAHLVNTNGTVRFYDEGATNHTRRFYRALAP